MLAVSPQGAYFSRYIFYQWTSNEYLLTCQLLRTTFMTQVRLSILTSNKKCYPPPGVSTLCLFFLTFIFFYIFNKFCFIVLFMNRYRLSDIYLFYIDFAVSLEWCKPLLYTVFFRSFELLKTLKLKAVMEMLNNGFHIQTKFSISLRRY